MNIDRKALDWTNNWTYRVHAKAILDVSVMKLKGVI
jgi:hypothetical protein